MSLPDNYVQIPGKLSDLFRALSEGQAPPQFTRQYLKDIGFRSSNFHAVIPLLKTLGFLSDTGEPTARYHDYRNPAQARKIMGQALKEAYADLFVIKSQPKDDDRPLIEGKFKSTHNTSERLAKLMASTFYSLLELADVSAATAPGAEPPPPAPPVEEAREHLIGNTNGNHPPTQAGAAPPQPPLSPPSPQLPSLHYNIQVHLPATKDVEVFNAIFKSLKEHFLA